MPATGGFCRLRIGIIPSRMKSVIRIRPVSQLGILLAALLIPGLPAAAQSAAASGSGGSASHDSEVVALDRLTVKGDRLFSELFVADRSLAGTKTSTPLVETSQSLTVIGRNEMDARGVQRLTDAVSYVAGVQAEFQGIDSRVDTLKVRGFEAGGFASNTYLDNLRAPSGGQWTRAQFDLFGLERVEVLKGPSAVPEDMASLWLSYVFSSGPLDGLIAGAGVRYVGESYGNDANTIKVPGYTLVDAAISYDFGKKFPALKGAALRLSATNLADKRYVATSTAPSAAWYGSGRNVSLSVRYNW